MADGPVVSNTTPLIVLGGIGLLGLLPRLFGEIWVPTAVATEYRTGLRPGEQQLDGLSWLLVKETVVDETLPSILGAGEAAAISLAQASAARAVLLDERLGRRVALARGLPVVGTLAVLLRAKQQGLLPALRPVITRMVEQGRHIGPDLVAAVLRSAGEVTNDPTPR